jgi:hypothetical protein
MAVKIQPLTKSQLVGYFNDYRSAFPDWEVEHDVVLARSDGPLKQRIAFEALRSGAYRPSHSIEVLIAPDVRVLAGFLDIKHREVLPREHAAKWPRVLKAMEEQFLPSIRRPLDAAEVLQLAEEEVVRDRIDKTHYSVALAALNAFTGNSERAIWWCERVPAQLASLGREPVDWERCHADYAEALREATGEGRARQFLLARLGQQR